MRTLVAAILLLTGFQAPVESAWLTKYKALESQIGDSYANDSSSANLAWGESYISRSYLDVYQATQDTTWLDKLVTHTDRVLASATDPDGDGYLGWNTHRYSPNETTNPSFESALTGWTRFQDTGTHIYTTTDVPAGTGTQSVRVVSDQTKWKKLHSTVLSTYQAGTKHVLRGWGKRTGSVVGRIVLRDASTTLCLLEYATSTWTYKETTCTLPAGKTLEVWLEHADYKVGGSAYFDDVKLSGSFPYIVHDAMIGIPIAEFIRLVAQTPALSGYSAKAGQYRTFLENEVVPRWEQSSYVGNTWNATKGTYQQSPNWDEFSHTRPSDDLPDNMALGFANLLMILYSVNGSTTYLDRATRVGTWARSHFTTSGSAYLWNYATYATQKEDISHANVDLSAYLELYRSGRVFTAADMTALKNTLTTKMWNGTTFSLYVDGSGAANGADYYLHSWLELTPWDPQVKTLVAAKYTNFAATNSSHLITLSRLLKWE